MTTTSLPPAPELFRAFDRKDPSYDGLFLTAVKTTGIFCRPTCPARKPKRQNVEFFGTAREALVAGYRPCQRCRPLEPPGLTPPWLAPLLDVVERDPTRRWTDADLRRLALDPGRVRRWFQRRHGMTFHAYHRARRLGLALGRIHDGEGLSRAGYSHGYESESGFREAFGRQFGTSPGLSNTAGLAVVTRLASPLGPLVAGAVDDGVVLLEFADRRMLERQIARIQKRLGCVVAPGTHPMLAQLEEELGQYFAGRRQSFDVPLVIAGTPFQEEVWRHLARIPFGETTSYDALAQAIGRPQARRAVGRANGDNRLAILLPCHRVVGRDGHLTGYGGGVWRKRWLLELERSGAPPASEATVTP